MNLVSFSIKTKGLHNFTRRLWTVFARFGFTERRTREALYAIINGLKQREAAPTFFIPAIVLQRHPCLIRGIVQAGAEVGVHGYVHNDYRHLSQEKQEEQTGRAVSIFKANNIPYRGFRNPYLGWTEASLGVFSACGFSYESNQAVLHEVVDEDALPPLLKSGYEKSKTLFQAMPCTTYTLRPHFEGPLLRIPLSIPDDEMLFDRLRLTDPGEVGRAWSAVMQRVYEREGVYVLNLHPERGILCKQALDILLSNARGYSQPVWIARLEDIAQWWKERTTFAWQISRLGNHRWGVEATCTPRATLLVRHMVVEDAEVTTYNGIEERVASHRFTVQSDRCPCLGISPETPQRVIDVLCEQGYPAMRCDAGEAESFSLYIDVPEGVVSSREARAKSFGELVERIEGLRAPLVRFGCWPDRFRAALSVTGDIDSVTIQDFFLRILEVAK